MIRYQNLIFDLGNVLYAIDYALTDQAFIRLQAKYGIPAAQFPTPAAQPVMEAYEKGLIDTPTFRSQMRVALKLAEATDDELDEAWNALLLGMFPGRDSLMAKLKEKYCIVLLSNTNALHWDYLKDDFEPTAQHMHQLFVSFEMGARKPDRDIFDQLLQSTGFRPEETIFIDDTAMHLATAAQLGLHTHHMTGEPAFRDFLLRIGA
jgi:putative hydrolase of the HAD superfamily